MVRHGICPRATAQLPLLKIGAGGAAECCLQAAEPVWVDTHWVGRRQWLCVAGSDDACPGCWVCSPRRCGYVVVLAAVAQRIQPMLLEVTQQSWSGLDGLSRMEFGGIDAGLVVRCSRKSLRSSMRIEPLSDGRRVSEEFGGWHRCVSAMAVLFGLPLPTPDDDAETWSDHVCPIARAKLAAAITQASKQG